MRFSTATLSLVVMLSIAHVTWADEKTDEAAIKDDLRGLAKLESTS
jgi:hypothetical protein